MATGSDPDRAFLELFPSEHRGAIANFFFNAIRDGETEARAICSAVFRHVKRVHGYCIQSGRECHGVQHEDVLRKLGECQAEALRFAVACVQQEQMDPVERANAKAERERLGKLEWMKTKPATEKQIAVLRRLGYTGEIANKGEASELIEKMKDW